MKSISFLYKRSQPRNCLLLLKKTNNRSTHPVLIILIGEFPVQFKATFFGPKTDGRMRHAIEHGCLHNGIVDHILEHDRVAHLQGGVERPVAHKIATQTAVPPHAVGRLTWHRLLVSTTDTGFVRHLQTIGHMTGEGDIEHGCLHAVVFNDISHGGQQHTCLPSEGAPRLHDDLQLRITLFQRSEHTYQVFDVIVTMGHQVTATQVEPLNLREEMSELLFYHRQRTFLVVGVVLAEVVQMQSRDAVRQRLPYPVGGDAQS